MFCASKWLLPFLVNAVAASRNFRNRLDIPLSITAWMPSDIERLSQSRGAPAGGSTTIKVDRRIPLLPSVHFRMDRFEIIGCLPEDLNHLPDSFPIERIRSAFFRKIVTMGRSPSFLFRFAYRPAVPGQNPRIPEFSRDPKEH
jgi:hypothetical protein